MTRGRKRDLTLPPSRALTQQREYRSRKALYISSLEQRCQTVETENAQLRLEVAALKQALAASNSKSQDPQLMNASHRLLDDLKRTISSLQEFHSISRSQPSTSPQQSNLLPNEILRYRPPHSDTPDPSVRPSTSSLTSSPPGVLRPLPPDDTPSPMAGPSHTPDSDSWRDNQKEQLGQTCCYGWVDCHDLAESDDEDHGSVVPDPMPQTPTTVHSGQPGRLPPNLPDFLKEFAKNPPGPPKFPEASDPRTQHRFQ